MKCVMLRKSKPQMEYDKDDSDGGASIGQNVEKKAYLFCLESFNVFLKSFFMFAAGFLTLVPSFFSSLTISVW